MKPTRKPGRPRHAIWPEVPQEHHALFKNQREAIQSQLSGIPRVQKPRKVAMNATAGTNPAPD